MRARVVLYNQKTDSVLLIHRLKKGRDYWVIPGGGAKKSESPSEAAIREINEELGIKLQRQDLKPLFELNDQGEKQLIFEAKISFVKAPPISGEEKDRANENNVYQPSWVSFCNLPRINLMPPEISQKIFCKISK